MLWLGNYNCWIEPIHFTLCMHTQYVILLANLQQMGTSWQLIGNMLYYWLIITIFLFSISNSKLIVGENPLHLHFFHNAFTMHMDRWLNYNWCITVVYVLGIYSIKNVFLQLRLQWFLYSNIFPLHNH